MNIKKTTKYDMFKLVTGNRDLEPTNLRKLTASILHKNMLHVNPIIVSQDMRVLDGQHRLEVARQNGLEIYYVVLEGRVDLKTIQELNTAARLWSLSNFVDSSIKLGKTDYQVLKDYSEYYGIPLSVAAALLVGQSPMVSGRFLDKVKKGEFKVTSLNQARIVGDAVLQLRPYMAKGFRIDRNFVTALRRVIDEDEIKRLVHKLEVNGRKLERQVSVKDFLRQFEDLINFGTQTKNQIRLYV